MFIVEFVELFADKYSCLCAAKSFSQAIIFDWSANPCYVILYMHIVQGDFYSVVERRCLLLYHFNVIALKH